MHTAYPIPAVQGWAGQRWAYRLEPPLDTPDTPEPVGCIVVSHGLQETMAFPADETGQVTSWREVRAAARGTSAAEVLGQLGYAIEATQR